MLHIGARLARRFSLLATEAADVPGLERFSAYDSRLERSVRIDVITALAPSAVRQAAAAAARVRDPRLLRVIASGRERIDENSYTYVVTDRPEGTPLSDVLQQRLVLPRIAGAIVGDAARALEKANAENVHHGYLRASAISIARNGRVTVAGLGVDGELAMQAGVGRGATESSDAMALGRIFLAAITGKDATAATERDLPAELGVRGRKLCIQVIGGTGPTTLDAVTRTFAPIDTRILRDFPALVRAMPLLPEPHHGSTSSPADAGIVLPEEVATRADDAAQQGLAEELAEPELAASLAQLDSTTGMGLVPPDQSAGMDAEAPEPSQPPILREALVAHPEVEALLGANELHDLYEFEEMVAVQDVNNTTSTWEALLQRMHRRWPGSTTITRRLKRAHKRANRSGPIWAAPVLIPLLVIGVVVATVVAVSLLKAPLSQDANFDDLPSNPYPFFTYSPSPSPSLSPSASPSPSASSTGG